MIKSRNTKKNKIGQKLARLGQFFKLVFIPHSKNDYQPHLIRRGGLIIIFLAIIAIHLIYNQTSGVDILGTESNITINSLLEKTNQEREKNNQNPLVLNQKLNQAALLKAKNMFSEQYWAHIAPDGTPPWKWFSDAGYNYDEAGENLAKNYSSIDTVMTAWMNSPEHRENILKKDYKDVGFAVMDGELNGQATSLVVAMYGLSSDDAAISSQKLFSGAVDVGNNSLLGKIIVIIQSFTPAATVGLSILTIALIVSTLAHVYRRRLPKELRKSWHRHHGLYKAIGIIVFGLIIISTYTGGQI